MGSSNLISFWRPWPHFTGQNWVKNCEFWHLAMKRIFSFSFELWMFKLIYVVPLGGLLTWLVFGGRDLILKVKMGSKTVNFDVSCFVMHFLWQFWAHDKKRYLCYVFRYDLRLIKFWRWWPYFWGRNRVTNFDICIILSCIMHFLAQFLV